MKVLVHPEKDSLEAVATLPAFFALGQYLEEAKSSREAGLSVLGPSVRSMTRYVDEDLHGAEFRE